MDKLNSVLPRLMSDFPGRSWVVTCNSGFLIAVNDTSVISLSVSDIVDIDIDDNAIKIATDKVSLNFHKSGILFIRVDLAF